MDETKDRRINVRLDEDTYLAIKKIVEKDLKTDLSSYCRSLLWISTLHDAAVYKIKKAVERFGKETDTENIEYMLKIKSEIEFIGRFLEKVRDDRKKYDEFIARIEKWHGALLTEARRYFKKHNDMVDFWEKEEKDFLGDDYDTKETMSRAGYKIDI